MKLALQTAADLFGALRDPSVRTRLAVLRAIAARPEMALALGRVNDWDVIDELIHQSYQSCSVPYYRALLRALAAYPDERVTAFFAKVAVMTRDEEIRALVTERSPAPGETPAATAGSDESGDGRTPSEPDPR